jgi:hypothetical protein
LADTQETKEVFSVNETEELVEVAGVEVAKADGRVLQE